MDKSVRAFTLKNFAVGLLLATACSPAAQATPTHYFPGSNANYTGGSNSFPLNSTSSNKCQWLYKSTDFNSVPSGASLITTIYIKPSTTRNNQSITGLTIKLRNTTLTTLSSGTWISGLTTVYGPTTGTISTSANAWKAFTLSTPFLYTGGNLVLEISQSGSATGISLNQYSVSGRRGRMYGSRTSSSSSGADAATALFGFDVVPASCAGTPGKPSITNAAMNAAAPICAGGHTTLAAFDPNAPISNLSYHWQSSASSSGPWANVTTGSGGTTLHYTTGPLSSSTWFRMGVTCNVSNITNYSSAYLVRIGATQPGNITGRASACPGDQATYTVPAVAGHSYIWTLPSGWTGSSTSNSINVTMGSPGTISVRAAGCGSNSVARTRTIVMGSAPATPGTMSGVTHVCSGTYQTYGVVPVTNAQAYSWTLPSGWTGTSTTDTMTALIGSTSGPVQVSAINGCGSSSLRTKAVTVITSLANPGTITSSAGSGPYCTGRLYSFSINPVPGATYYIWTLPSGWTGTNTGTSIQAYAGSSGQIYANAYVACATSPAATLSAPVTTTVNPAVSIAPGAALLCKGQPATFTATPTNGGSNPGYQWMKNGKAVIASGNSYTTNSLATGDVISVSMISSAACRSSDTVTSAAYHASLTPSVTPGISINSNPVVRICSGTPMTFTTKIAGSGLHPEIQWYKNGIAISGADDSSLSPTAISNGDTFSVEMKSDAVCRTDSMAFSNKVRVDVDAAVTPSLAVTASTSAAETPVTFTVMQTGGGATPTFQWVLNNVDVPGEMSDTYISPGLRPGDRVAVRMQSYAPCALPPVVTSDEIIIGDPTSVSALQGWPGELGIYPNPNSGQFTLVASGPAIHKRMKLRLELFSVIGQCVYTEEIQPAQAKWEHQVRLNESLPAGHYTLRLTSPDGMQAHLPIVLRR